MKNTAVNLLLKRRLYITFHFNYIEMISQRKSLVTHHLSINGFLDKKTLGTASVTPCDSHVATMVDILDIHIKKIYLAIIEIAEDLFLFSQDKQNVSVRFLNVFFHVAD